MPRQIILMDTARINRSLHRMAMQLEEIFPPEEELIIVGLNERGFVLAQSIAAHFQEENKESELILHRLNTKDSDSNPLLPNCAAKNVVIIDDVIFSGGTMFGALTSVCVAGNPKRIKLLALVDRGHRQFPLQAAIVGISIPTKFGEHIEVMLDSGKPSQVVLFKN